MALDAQTNSNGLNGQLAHDPLFLFPTLGSFFQFPLPANIGFEAQFRPQSNQLGSFFHLLRPARTGFEAQFPFDTTNLGSFFQKSHTTTYPPKKITPPFPPNSFSLL
jgi:hypothetical protein